MEEEVSCGNGEELINKVKLNIKKEAIDRAAVLIEIIETETSNSKQLEQIRLLKEIQNLIEFQKKDNSFKKIKDDLQNWRWTNSEEGIEYLEKKIRNNQWLSQDRARYQEQIDFLRQKFQEFKNDGNEDFNLQKFVEENTKEHIDDLKQKLEEKKAPITKLTNEYSESRFNLWQESRRIVWGKPNKINDPKGSNTVIDDFKYSGKTLEKTVYIPFSDIHKAIIDANWTFRNGERNPEGNYLTGHLVFVVTNQPHRKQILKNEEGVNQKNEKGEDLRRYIGGRTFVDFPIVMPIKLIEQQRIFEDQKAFEKFLDSKTTYGYGVGENNRSNQSGAHSELALKEFLENKDNINGIVTTLKNKLIAKFGESRDFKVYELVLFLNSQRNICDMGNGGCEKILSDLQSSKEKDSFLELLKTELQKQDFKTLAKEEFPRIFITDTSYMVYDSYCSNSLKKDAIEGMGSEDNEVYSIDIKELARKVILSTKEAEIGEVGRKNIEKYKSPISIPFYSGFTSAKGKINNALLGKKRKDDNIPIDLPKSFDDIDIITVKKKPSSLVKVESVENLFKEKEVFKEI